MIFKMKIVGSYIHLIRSHDLKCDIIMTYNNYDIYNMTSCYTCCVLRMSDVILLSHVPAALKLCKMIDIAVLTVAP